MLDLYEDWRLSADERARDLAFRMSVEQIAGLEIVRKYLDVTNDRTQLMQPS